jgi:fumarylpyruvate hydrolase
MADLLFPAQLVSLSLQGDPRRLPVRRIYCVGRNYAEHIREMGGDEREPPFFFQKPTDAIVEDGAVVPYPSLTEDFQHEVELVLAIGREGVDIPMDQAARHVCALGVGIDLTRRDVQVLARKGGRPWEIGKSFDRSAPCSALKLTEGSALPTSGHIELRVNGARRQAGDLSQMIWSAAEIVSKLSEQYLLRPGDLIYTGTPAGVAAVHPGDRLSASLDGVGRLDVSIGGRGAPEADQGAAARR